MERTENLDMYLFQSTDPVFFGDINHNTRTLDALSNTIDSGEITIQNEDGSSISWLYKKTINVKKSTSDTICTLDLWTRITLGGVRANTNISGTSLYQTGELIADFPDAYPFTSLYGVQLSYHTSNYPNSTGFVVNVTNTSNTEYLTKVKYRILTFKSESSATNKVISIYAKGLCNK